MVLGAVTKDVIFRIGSSGGAATAAKFAAVAAAIALTGKKMFDAVKEAQKFGQIIERVTIDMTEFNKATKGLIGTTESYIGAAKLQQAGMDVSADQMKTIGVAAIQLAKATGQDATAAFERLTTGIAKGSTRALKELGLDLENTEDLVLAQEEALDKLTAKFGKMTVEVETAEEAFFRFKNVVGTTQDQLVLGAIEAFGEAAQGTGNIVGDLTAQLEWFSDSITETNGELAKWMFTAEGATHSAKMLGNVIFDTLIPFTDHFSDNIETLNDNFDKMVVKMKTIALAGKTLNNVGAQLGINLSNALEGAKVSAEENAKLLREINALEQKTFKKKRGKGGRAARAEVSDIVGEQQRQRVDAQMKMMEAIIREEERAAAKKLKQEEALEKERLKLKKQAAAEQQKLVEQQLAAETKARQNAAAAGVQALSDLGTLMNSESRKAFAVGKTAAIAEATISTYVGAQKAFSSLAGVGPVGPALGAAAAAAAIAAGTLRVKKIVETRFGGGSSLTGGGSISLPSTSAGSAAAVNAPVQEEAIDRRPIQVIMDGRMVTDAIVEDSIKRQRQGDRGLVVRT